MRARLSRRLDAGTLYTRTALLKSYLFINAASFFWCGARRARASRSGRLSTFFAYRPPSRPLGSLKSLPSPGRGRVTNPTAGPPWATLGSPSGRVLVGGCSGVSPSHRPSTGSCHRARSGSTARPDQWLPPCMHPRGTRGVGDQPCFRRCLWKCMPRCASAARPCWVALALPSASALAFVFVLITDKTDQTWTKLV